MGLLSSALSIGGAILGGPTGASIGGALGGAIEGSKASKKATKAQVEAEKRAQARYDKAIGRVNSLQEPFLAAGPTGMNALTGRLAVGESEGDSPGTYGSAENPAWSAPSWSYTLDDYEASPGYQWRQDQARKAIIASASATGARQSGAALKELYDRGDQIAYQDFRGERDFSRGVYRDDRDFGRGVYENDRNYLTSRFDRGTDDLYRYTGIGQGAADIVGDAELEAAGLGAQSERNIGQAKARNALTKGQIWGDFAAGLGGTIAGAYNGNALAQDLRGMAAANPRLF